MNILNSKITKVTVFNDRAQVTRIAETDTTKGEHIFRFENLPESIEEKSIQVNGLGKVLLKEIKYKDVYYEEVQDEKKKKLYNDAVQVQFAIQEISDQIAHAEKEKQFMENIVVKITGESQERTMELNPENWMKMVEFYRTKLDSSDKEIRDANKHLTEQKGKLNKINKEISKLGINEGKTKKVVDVLIVAEETSKIALALTYIVYGPSWQPAYNLRVSSENKKILVEYNAVITQQTEEDWENIDLTISTAQVQIGGTVPVLSPWYVAKYVPAPPPAKHQKKGRERMLSKSAMAMKEAMAFDDFEGEEVLAGMIEKPKPMIKPNIHIEEKATSTTYSIAGKSTVLSNGDNHKTAIGVMEFDADFEYTIVPKLSTFAYLEAEITNKSDYVFLPGDANIFFDNSFVTETNLKSVQPEEKFHVSLGIDEGIKTEHKIIPAFNKDEGIFNKKQKKTFDFETIIKNAKKTDEKIKLLQHIPVSNDDNIEVKLISPKYKEETDSLKISKQGIVERNMTIKSNEETVNKLKFTVEYPRNMNVTGL
ncbi:MAG: mucoidy inhibitor MuiA family protein [Bacteroidales bacterium]|nr:mucoidy inhibitor MuiA family protein [Bacteroidales bacterium]